MHLKLTADYKYKFKFKLKDKLKVMFRKQDFKKVDLLGSGKKNTKIYKAEHIPTGKYYAIKEVEAKTLDKLNEYKVSIKTSVLLGSFYIYMSCYWFL